MANNKAEPQAKAAYNVYRVKTGDLLERRIELPIAKIDHLRKRRGWFRAMEVQELAIWGNVAVWADMAGDRS